MSDEVIVKDRDVWLMGSAFAMLALAVGVLLVSVFLVTRQGQDVAQTQVGLAQQQATLRRQQVTLRRQAREAIETHRAACTFRNNLKSQERSSEHYLALHPNGAPALGISAAQIRSSIAKQDAAVKSLSGLHCSS